MTGPQAALLPDGQRLHLHHGPIDLIIQAFGRPEEVETCYVQAVNSFETVLVCLADELDLLRSGDPKKFANVAGPVAKRMTSAVLPHAGFVTPMAAVAGAVADHVLERMTKGRDIKRAYVNNGGDCALYLASGERLTLSAVSDEEFGKIEVSSAQPVRGVATSGWRGRSHSLGIADAVTVLAKTAAKADVAATLIANQVDLPGHPSISRTKACDLSPDSDLGETLVTTDVGHLMPFEIEEALERGQRAAERMRNEGLIVDALFRLNGQTRQLATERLLVDG